MIRIRPLTALLFLIAFACNFLYAAEIPKPLLLVLNKPEGKLMMIDPAARKIVGEVPTGVGPHEVTVSADGKLAS